MRWWPVKLRPLVGYHRASPRVGGGAAEAGDRRKIETPSVGINFGSEMALMAVIQCVAERSVGGSIAKWAWMWFGDHADRLNVERRTAILPLLKRLPGRSFGYNDGRKFVALLCDGTLNGQQGAVDELQCRAETPVDVVEHPVLLSVFVILFPFGITDEIE